MPQLSDRILVVGAGPAGLTAAMALKDKGYTHVTVFEREDQVGGKCRSFVHEGIAYDLGANLTTPRYTRIRALADRLGMARHPLSERRIVSLGPDEAPAFDDLHPMQQLLMGAAAEFYVFARAHTGVDQPGYAGLREGLRRPFGDWLRKNGLGAFREVFANLFVAYGYGVMDDLPAAYALKFFDEVHWEAAMDVVRGRWIETTTVFDKGFQELWVRAVNRWDLDVRTGTTLRRIDRSSGIIEVQFERGGAVHEATFDHLVLACPLKDSLSFLDAAPLEHKRFSQIETYDYYVTATILRGVPDVGTFVYPFSMRFTPGWPTVFYPPIPGDPHDVFFFYSYGDEATTAEEVQDNLREIIARPEFNGELETILTTKHWSYFPHVSTAVMQDGFFEDVDALQGAQNTYYVGEVLSFTLVELVAEYSDWIVDRFF